MEIDIKTKEFIAQMSAMTVKLHCIDAENCKFAAAHIKNLESGVGDYVKDTAYTELDQTTLDNITEYTDEANEMMGCLRRNGVNPYYEEHRLQQADLDKINQIAEI